MFCRGNAIFPLPYGRCYAIIFLASGELLIRKTADGTEYAGMAQSVERRIGSAEVPGPIPGAS